MKDSANRPQTGNTILLFGPQALSFQEESFHRLRSTLLDSSCRQWVLDTLTELPSQWKRLAQRLPKLQVIPGEKLLEELNVWFQTGQVTRPCFNLPSVLLSPLVVINQLAQYAKYLEFARGGAGGECDPHVLPSSNVETLGFCTGLLSALAVSSSASQEHFQRYGAVAVRLAMLVGAVVDAQDASDPRGASQSLATVWASLEGEEEMSRILNRFPEGYVSVCYDDNRATVTTAQGTASALQSQLRTAAIVVKDVSLRGRFHCPCYQEDVDALMSFCDSDINFQFPDAAGLVLPTRSNSGGQLITQGALHHAALRSILLDKSEWFQAFTASYSSHPQALIVCFGPERCVPPSLLPTLNSQTLYMADLDDAAAAARLSPQSQVPRLRLGHSDDDIAVVGMSCKVAGADDVDEFWKILCAGESQHQEVPGHRFDFETPFRDVDSKRKWYGNFMRDHDAFDHKFFKKSPREAGSMDPQQRLMLQVAYQAVEQSGYFQQTNAEENVGCYIGVCSTDYQHNVACHPANAYSATGNLASFTAGKISHYFGWTGPGLVIDTACSSSAVAVHQACRAILSGECNSALAAGALVITSPLWFQNLAGASFLSPTGSSKPFDAKADGYCRGEGVAAVFLKKMSTAVSDGDLILGCVASTAVHQNENCTPIFVPNSPSLSKLFRQVTHQARLEPKDITAVEAHGTGTPVGDPAEWDSIREALGGQIRPQPLPIGSVKGHIGHTECTSGLVALIKTLLMISEGLIPPQASFHTINPKIHASPTHGMEVVTQLKPWKAEFRAALINNYGASGSNASMVVTQPFRHQAGASSSAIHATSLKHPFWFCGTDERSIRDYSTRLLDWIRSHSSSAKPFSLGDLALNVSRQSNRSLDLGLIFSSQSVLELESQLTAFINGTSDAVISKSKITRPVILCFGGQVSNFIGLDRVIYNSVTILRTHMDVCNAAIQSIGLRGIYPGIFQRTPVEDTVELQLMLFATQYACARSWIGCGVKVAAAVGHSFGELTALCVCGVLSLSDAVKLIARRAKLVRDLWGSERGSMMAVEGDLADVQRLLASASSIAQTQGQGPATIACFNGPRSFTLAGSDKAIDAVVAVVSQGSFSLRTKRLNVTNAFHSSLVDPLMADLGEIAKEITFQTPTIHVERATEIGSNEPFTPRFAADHMRNPVYFNNAVQRLAEKYPSAIWLESGSNSTVTTMVSRALGAPGEPHFQPMNISTDAAVSNVADATTSLWKAGLPVKFWAHHASQTYEYAPLLLPPYQFEKSRHWLELKKPAKVSNLPVAAPLNAPEELPKCLWTFVGFRDSKQRSPRFRINTMIPKYEEYLKGHWIAQQAPICPATLQMDIALEAIVSLRPDLAATNRQPQIRHVKNQAPICKDASRLVWLEADALDVDGHSWDWKVVSTGTQKGAASLLHATGQMVFPCADDPQIQLEFARYERLVSHQRCQRLLNSATAEDVIQGRNIYRAFADVVDYSEMYRGVQKLVGKDNESAGRVVKQYVNDTWLDAVLADCFSQVGGIWVNCMTDRPSSTLYIANAIEQWVRSPKLRREHQRPQVWDVFATHHLASEKAFCTDVFVFDSTTGTLMEAILGISYVQVAQAAMKKLLARLTEADATLSGVSATVPIVSVKSDAQELVTTAATPKEQQPKPAKPTKPEREQKPKPARNEPDVAGKIRALIADLCGLEADRIQDNAQLADMGIDSLMGMELAKAIEDVFNCTIPTEEMGEITDFQGIVGCVRAVLGPIESVATDSGDDDNYNDAGGKYGQSMTPTEEDISSATSVSSGAKEEMVDDLAKKVTKGLQSNDLQLPGKCVREAFNESKRLTDQFIADCGFVDYLKIVNPKQTQLCVMLIIEAFETLGCSLRTAKPGQTLERIPHVFQHEQLVDYLYDMLDTEARLIDRDGVTITRTSVSMPKKSSEAMLNDLQRTYPSHRDATQLAYFCGTRLADILKGKEQGVKLIFGTDEGRDLVSKLYGDWPLNRMYYQQMADFLKRLAAKLPRDAGPLKILEMGAGTAGTTKVLVPVLASLDIPIEYTFTDLSPSFVAAARRKFKGYEFMKFRSHDIEKQPADDLLATQHVVIASNAVHATHSLAVSTQNIRKALRPDGFLMMLEMTSPVYFIDIIFGLFEGWWLFDDGRHHAISHQSRWEKALRSVGYGHVDWTDGNHPEVEIERLILAMASGPRYELLSIPPPPIQPTSTDCTARQVANDAYVRRYTHGWSGPAASESSASLFPAEQCVMVTGASGSLGSHLAAHFARLASVATVVCINRHSNADPAVRQREALESRGVFLSPSALAKLKVFETDTCKTQLGLLPDEYDTLVRTVTHICHNAWPMSGKRPVKGFEGQFQAMRNLLDLVRDIACQRDARHQVSFQLISSIATVGHYPLWTGDVTVPEERMTIDSVLPNGYGDAKYVCELMLDETLHHWPDRFRTMAVRLGQVAGSRRSGWWNPMEHLSFLIKSSQTLKALPDLDGKLSWTPVDDVASTLSDLLVSERRPYPIYHIDNPVRQPWREMLPVLADALAIPCHLIPFRDWLHRVETFPGSAEDNPAAKMADFLRDNFIRMSCGGLLLGTDKSVEHSSTLAGVGPVSAEVVRQYVRAWQDMGFLHK